MEDPPSEPVRTFPVKGVVEGVTGAGTVLEVRHEAIEGYMAAMSMPFDVGESAIPVRAEEGDTIAFRLHVAGNQSWIEDIRILEKGARTIVAPPPRIDFLQVGDMVPDFRFVNQAGRQVTRESLHGTVLALTFIYTRCPIPDFCPRMSIHFQIACAALGEKELPGPWRFLSLSFDPDHDTPEVLRRYSSAFACVPEHWDFLTGSREDIDRLALQCGLTLVRKRENSLEWDHSLRTLIIDPEGRIRRILIGNRWQPEELVREMQAAWEPMLDPGDGVPGAGDGQGDAGALNVHE